jgi:hypothetical protein
VTHIKKLHAPVNNPLTKVQQVQSNSVRDDWKIKANKQKSMSEFIQNVLSRSPSFRISTEVE